MFVAVRPNVSGMNPEVSIGFLVGFKSPRATAFRACVTPATHSAPGDRIRSRQLILPNVRIK